MQDDDAQSLDIFLVGPPGLEAHLADEARAAGFGDPRPEPGGVAIRGGWPDVWRANLTLRCASRVLVRVASFRTLHPAQLDKRARRVDWAALLPPGTPVRVEAECRKSRIYHAGAAAQRVARAIREGAGAAEGGDGAVRALVRIVDDLCVISLDSSGEPLHRRGTKQAVGKAPMRETLAALFLRGCGYAGAEPVVDPMCGSGTFVLEAAEIAAGLAPGRGRAFAFERFAPFEPEAWGAMRGRAAAPPAGIGPFLGSDRDDGAVAAARANAERAGLGAVCAFERRAVSDAAPPAGAPPGLVIVNPPYGARIGDRAGLRALYGALGGVLRARFAGWRVGLVTNDEGLARATGLPFGPAGPPVPHGPLKIRLYRTGPLG